MWVSVASQNSVAGGNKTSFIALLNADFQIALFVQLTSTNSYLLLHSILVRIDGLRYNIGKQK